MDYKHLINDARQKFSFVWPEKITDEDVERALRDEGKRDLSPESVLQIAIKASEAAINAASEAARKEGIEEGKQKMIRLMTSHRGNFEPPTVMKSVSPSLLESSPKHKRTFHDKIMEIEINHGAFVLVPAYLAFVKGAYEHASYQSSEQSRTLFNLSPWCPNQSEWEEQRSTAIADWLNQELVASCDFSDLEYRVSVTHQVPVLPKTKEKKQVVDIGVLTWKVNDQEAIPAAMIEHKVKETFPSFESQASMYGTDCQNITERSVILIQTRGSSLGNLELVAYGIMRHWDRQAVKPTHLRSLLLRCQGEDGLRQVASGLRSFIPALLKEEKGQNNGYVLSAVCARHDGSSEDSTRVYKSFDYRYREVNRKRDPHLKLYQELVCPSTVFEIEREDLHILSMPHFGIEKQKQQYGPIKGNNLRGITKKVCMLHERGLVHGDIRLANMLPHHGLLIDFDYTAKAGTIYPEGFLHLGWDGRRARAVREAIDEGKIGQLPMACDHDIESLYFVLNLYGAEEPAVEHKWRALLDLSPSLEELFEKMGEFADHVFDMKFKDSGYELGTGGTPGAKNGNEAKRARSQNESSREVESVIFSGV